MKRIFYLIIILLILVTSTTGINRGKNLKSIIMYTGEAISDMTREDVENNEENISTKYYLEYPLTNS